MLRSERIPELSSATSQPLCWVNIEGLGPCTGELLRFYLLWTEPVPVLDLVTGNGFHKHLRVQGVPSPGSVPRLQGLWERIKFPYFPKGVPQGTALIRLQTCTLLHWCGRKELAKKCSFWRELQGYHSDYPWNALPISCSGLHTSNIQLSKGGSILQGRLREEDLELGPSSGQEFPRGDLQGGPSSVGLGRSLISAKPPVTREPCTSDYLIPVQLFPQKKQLRKWIIIKVRSTQFSLLMFLVTGLIIANFFHNLCHLTSFVSLPSDKKGAS